MNNNFYRTLSKIQRVNKLYIDYIKRQLLLHKIDDIKPVEALIISKIGKKNIYVKELYDDGFCLGTNISYNLNKLKENGYILKDHSSKDMRCCYISLTPKGIKVFKMIEEDSFSQEKYINRNSPINIKDFNKVLHNMEKNLLDRHDCLANVG